MLWKSVDVKPEILSFSSSGSNTSVASLEQTQLMEQFSIDSKSPDVYDKPGLWKFLCLVCMRVRPFNDETNTCHSALDTEWLASKLILFAQLQQIVWLDRSLLEYQLLVY